MIEERREESIRIFVQKEKKNFSRTFTRYLEKKKVFPLFLWLDLDERVEAEETARS